MSEPIWRTVEPAAEAPLQFGIRDLLIAQAICAVCLGLSAMIGIFALLAIFVVTLFSCGIRVRPEQRKLKRCTIDLMGGIALPAMCLLYDPFVFREMGGSGLRTTAFAAIVCQLVALPLWMVAGRYMGRWSALLGGVLLVGAGVAAMVGLTLIPMSLIGLFVFGIGLLGATPFLTSVVFWRNGQDAMRHAGVLDGSWDAWLLMAVGLSLAVAIPVFLSVCFGPWVETAIRLLPQPRGSLI
jgi:hypothetical protein